MTTVPFKIFGLQCSCTNLVTRLLLDYFDTLSCERIGGWKHAAITDDTLEHKIAGPLRVIICVRHPLAWLPAVHRYFERHKNADLTICDHYRRGWSFDRFCRSRHYGFANPVDRWNALNRHYLGVLEAHPDRGIRVRSEDLMGPEDQRREIRRIQDALHLVPTAAFRPIVHRVDNWCRVRREKMDFDYYKHRAYLEDYSPELAAWVMDRLDMTLMAELGYEHETEGQYETETKTKEIV